MLSCLDINRESLDYDDGDGVRQKKALSAYTT